MPPGRLRAVGDRIGPYEIVRHLASGGMGDVYEARSASHEDLIALKLLGDASTTTVVRFEREAKIAAGLRHPHIISTIAHGRADDGTPFMAMELLRGTDLRTRLNDGAVSCLEALTIATQICDALEHAHSRHIVHRDLKPDNIFLCDGPRLHAKVLDFGIAKILGEQHLTMTGAIIGTMAYLSPEQARGDRDIDHRSDLWSLAVVLYEILAGTLPFESATGPGVIFQILFGTPPSVLDHSPQIPRALADVVNRGMCKSVNDRFPSATAMRAALTAVDTAAIRASLRAPASMNASAATAASEVANTEVSATRSQLEDSKVETRLVSVAFLKGVRDPLLVEGLADDLDGRAVRLAGGDMLAIFGMDRWVADEPARAVRLAVGAGVALRAASVATGKATRTREQMIGSAVNRAAALVEDSGVHLDAATVSATRGRFVISLRDDGTGFIAPRERHAMATAAQDEFATPFVGREIERSMLLDSVHRASTTLQPAGVGILGASGSGKSRLRNEALAELRLAEPGASTLIVRCEAFRRDAAFASLRDGLAECIDPSLALAFAATPHGTADPQVALDRARGALETILRGLADGGPVVLVIDDAQWLDPSSRAAIRWVCENAADLPLAIWMFGRVESRDAILDVLPAATTRELAPLSREMAEQIVRALAGDAPEILLERAAGHPLFLEELARMYAKLGAAALGDGALPLSIEGALIAQLDSLDGVDRAFLKRAAIFGRRAWQEGVAYLGADPDAATRLRRAGLLLPRQHSRLEGQKEFAIRSAMLQEVAYGLWTDEQRAALHAKAAAWLAETVGVSPEELAKHWDLGREPARAADAYVRAAEASCRVADSATTCGQAERALALSSDPHVRWRAMIARDTALQLTGDIELQRLGLEQIAVLAETLGLAEQAEAATRQCYLTRVTSNETEALEHALRAIELTERLGEPRAAVDAHNEIALLYANLGRYENATEYATTARRMSEDVGDPWLQARSAFTLGFVVSAAAGNPVAALELFDAAARGYATSGDRRREAPARSNAADCVLRLGRFGDALERIEASIELSRKVGNARSLVAATLTRATIRRILGEHAGAEEDLLFAAREAERLGRARQTTTAAVEQIYVAIAKGAGPAEFQSLADTCERVGAATPAPDLAAPVAAATLRARARGGEEVSRALSHAREQLRRTGAMPESAFEIAVALYETDGRSDSDRNVARAALEQATRMLPSSDDAAAYRSALGVRYIAPPEVMLA